MPNPSFKFDNRKKNIQKNPLDLKSFWREVERKDFRFYCAGCHKERHLFSPPKVGTATHFFQVSLTTAFFTLVTWPVWEWKGVVAFVPIWIVFEVYFRMKMRAALVCSDCGFDPILYLVDSQKAAQAVEQHWRKKFEERGWAYPERRVRGRMKGSNSVYQSSSLIKEPENEDPDQNDISTTKTI